MAFSRQLGVVGILSACFFVAVGCGDDDDKKDNGGDAGEGGESGSAGTGGKAAGGSSSGSAGKAGSSTTAGSANDGGAAGETGRGGGGAGPVGGVAGESGSGGAAAGSGGEGGVPPALAPKQCSYGCEVDADCEVDGEPSAKSCDPETKVCLQCKADSDCLAESSFWFAPCENDSGCTPDFEACVEVNGEGVCAPLSDAENTEDPCGGLGLPKSLKRFGTEGNIIVCAADARCVAGECGWGCADPLFGSCDQSATGNECNEENGRCECSGGEACDSGVCGANKQCGCVTDDDCTTDGLDKCDNGVCVCASADSCTVEYDGATATCE